MKQEAFDLEQAIAEWLKQLRKYEAYEDGQILEMEDHLRSEINQLSFNGYSEQAAYEKAVDSFGDPLNIHQELSKFRSRSILLYYLPASFKIALRKLKKNAALNLMNICSLSIGLAIVLFIALFIRNEYSYDRYHKKGERIYRLELDLYQSGQWIPSSSNSWYAGEIVQLNAEEVEEVAHVMRGEATFSVGENRFKEKKIGLVSATFFDIFSAAFIAGNPKEALKEPSNIVIDEKLAKKYFGNQNPIGKQLLLEEYQQLFTVKGVIAPLPHQSHFSFDLFIPFEGIRSHLNPQFFTNAGWTACFNYFLLKEGASIESLATQFDRIVDTHFTEFNSENLKLRARPLFDIHFFAHSGEELAANQDFRKIQILSYIAIAILLLSVFNYLNLNTARYQERVKEVGLRKVFGAGIPNIRLQFLTESLVYTFLAFLLAGLWVAMTIPFLELTLGIPIILPFGSFELGLTIAFWVLLSCLISIHPAWLLPKVQIAGALAKKLSLSTNSTFRSTLIFSQFTITIVLLVGLGVVSTQVKHLQESDPGFQKEHIFYFQNRGLNKEKLYSLTDKLLQEASITQVGLSSISIPGPLQSSTFFRADSIPDSPDNVIKAVYVDDHFFSTLNIELSEGSPFDRKKGPGQIILNEAAVKRMAWKQAINKSFTPKNVDWQGKVVGVAKDFNFESLYNEIIPIAFIYEPSLSNWIYVKYEGDLSLLLPKVEQISNQFYTNPDFEAILMDEVVHEQYKEDQILVKLAAIFTLLSLIIAGIGIFGMALFITQKRTKEIAIRKIIGASIGQLFWFMTNDLLGILVVASIVACPIGYYFSNQWLLEFPYRIDLGYNFFLTSILFTVILTLIAAGIIVLKTAFQRPTKSLRHE